MLDAGDGNSLGTHLLAVLSVMELGKHSKRVSKKYRVAEKTTGFFLSRDMFLNSVYFKELISVDGKKSKRCKVALESFLLSQT